MMMKGSFEDYLYILIGIVWVAFSIYQGQKKKKQKTSQQTVTEKKKSFFETLLDEITEKNQQVDDSIEYESETVLETVEVVNTSEEPKFSYDDYYEESNYDEAKDALVKIESIEQSFPEKKLKSSTKKNSKRQFDLRKAVIYSEILKPRYF